MDEKVSYDGLSARCGGHGHGMKASVGLESVTVTLEVNVHPAEFNLTIMSEAVFASKPAGLPRFNHGLELNFKLKVAVGSGGD